MIGKTHLAGGVLAGAYIANSLQLDIVNTAGVITISAIAALFPDIDTSTSKIGLKVKPLSSLINHVFGHRKLFHAPLVYLLIAAALYNTLPLKLGLSISAGIGSHLLLDSITRQGIPWLYPFKRESIGFSPIRAGGVFDWLLCYGLLGLSAYVINLKI